MCDGKELDHEPADVMAAVWPHVVTHHLPVLLPLRKAASGDLLDTGVRVSVCVNVEWNLRQQQFLHAARMIHVAVRDDDVAHLLPREPRRRHPSA
jgi:hypothetical protein